MMTAQDREFLRDLLHGLGMLAGYAMMAAVLTMPLWFPR